MSISPCCIHDECVGIGADGFGEGFGSLLDDDIAPADLAWLRGIEGRTFGVVSVGELGNVDFGLETRLALVRILVRSSWDILPRSSPSGP